MSDLEFLLQKDWKQNKLRHLGSGSWITIYEDFPEPLEAGGIYSALVKGREVKRQLEEPTWGIRTEWRPGFSRLSIGDHERVSYQRNGGSPAVEPLVHNRSFSDLRKPHLELSEELRLFHNLYWEAGQGEFIKIFPDGRDEVVARLTSNCAKIRLPELRQFMAAKQMHLAIFFDRRCFSPLDVSDIGAERGPTEVREHDLIYNFHVSPSAFSGSGMRSVSRLLGKRLIAPPPIESCQQWPFFNRAYRFEEFIIGTDEAGQVIIGTAGSGPDYLTPIYFRRDVLSKYYSQPSKYAVRDGYLACGSVWGISIDNHHKDFVVVYLGDLDRDLPHSEQLYWKSFNVAPEGGVSEISARRDFLAEFVEPQRPELILKNLYPRANAHWKKGHGWNLFKELPQGDQHVLATLRVPLADEQLEFDEQVLGLTKLLVDALDEPAISRQLGSTVKDEKGIAKLERLLRSLDGESATEHTSFLRDLQELRSCGAAHLKGRNFERAAARLGIGHKNRRDIFEALLNRAISFLRYLEALNSRAHPAE